MAPSGKRPFSKMSKMLNPPKQEIRQSRGGSRTYGKAFLPYQRLFSRLERVDLFPAKTVTYFFLKIKLLFYAQETNWSRSEGKQSSEGKIGVVSKMTTSEILARKQVSPSQ